jgi:hypothetical protein
MTKNKQKKNPLQKQLEDQKFAHGIAYVKQAAPGIKKINSNELAHLNQLLTGQTDEPWRFTAVQVEIPTGQTQHFNVVSNPIQRARDILGNAQQRAGNGEVLEAAIDVYAQLVLEHLFNDANRRTAILATLWVLQSHQMDIDATKLGQIPIGNLRDPKDMSTLAQAMKSLAH